MTIKEYTPGMELCGLIAGLPNDIYHADDTHISKSGLDLINRSPAHFFYSARREPTRAMHLGTALHTAILEPEVFEESYMLLREVTDRRSAAYKDAAKKFGADNVLTAGEADSVAGMQESVRANAQAREAIDACEHKEISVFTTCNITGVKIKCRFDALSLSELRSVDLKTTRDARPEEFSKSIFNYRYHVQDAFYRHVFRCATGQELRSFEFIAIESDMPHAVMVYELDDISRMIGQSEFITDLRVAKACIESGHWPAYDNHSKLISIPEWAIMRFESENESDVIEL